jgi:hypothetical protein
VRETPEVGAQTTGDAAWGGRVRCIFAFLRQGSAYG